MKENGDRICIAAILLSSPFPIITGKHTIKSVKFSMKCPGDSLALIISACTSIILYLLNTFYKMLHAKRKTMIKLVKEVDKLLQPMQPNVSISGNLSIPGRSPMYHE